MKRFISLAGPKADLESFRWYVYEGHSTIKVAVGDYPITCEPGDAYGLKKATRGPTAGKYQVVVARESHHVFRSVPPEALEDLLEDSKPLDAMPDLSKKTGLRHARRVVQNAEIHDKQTSDRYKPKARPTEINGYDRAHYQWRQYRGDTPFKIHSFLYGKLKHTLHKSDMFGIRFVTPARGAYVVVGFGDNEKRIQIKYEEAEKLADATNILPMSKQLKGYVETERPGIIATKKAKSREHKIPRNIVQKDDTPTEADDSTGTPVSITDVAKKARQFVKENIPLASLHDYKEDDEDDDFDDEFDENEFEELPTEFEDDEVDIDLEDGVDPEDEEYDPRSDIEEVPEDDEEFQSVTEGDTVRLKNGEEWTAVEIEEEDGEDGEPVESLSSVVRWFNPIKNEVRIQRIPNNINIHKTKMFVYVKTVKGRELNTLRQRAARAKASGKRMV